ncbi:lipid-A-disaccharide synthase [Ramlibacter albus]|uniref:Lipid-A-disaccharide synthase n=1 Tax=Ramlibacter albus TaxID=2079448 RepID=A0A923MAZ1_9BURK|nr:lipid-A-disaccharide synthase [Ramlibacter albus]MBC5766660.1 lipid-A-disaccharide synthase [Ramlibacter albus]
MKVAMVAGETSGDLLGGALLKALQSRWPGLQAQGIGGERMMAQGFDAWWPSDKLAVRGYVEVLRHYREIVGIRNQLRDRLIASPPDVFIGIDAPDFNIDLEGALRERGIKTVHFVCPSIWAWRAERVHKIKRCCDHVLCLFPFEPELLHKHGIGATYVGHPLASTIPMEPDKAAARAALELSEDDDVVAILPGSRGSEVKYLAGRFFAAAAVVKKQRPKARFIVPAVPHLKAKISAAADSAGLGDALRVLDGQSHTALAACDVTLLASGTATLEAALFKRPMVVAYAMNWLTWTIHQRQHLQPWVALPNILEREFIVPELLQHDANPERLAGEVLDWFARPDRMAAVQEKFRAQHELLRRDTAKLATDAIEEVVNR